MIGNMSILVTVDCSTLHYDSESVNNAAANDRTILGII